MVQFSANETRMIDELAAIQDGSSVAEYMRDYGSFMRTQGSSELTSFLARLKGESQAPPGSAQAQPGAFQAYQAALQGLARVQLDEARLGKVDSIRDFLSAVTRLDGSASDFKADVIGIVADNLAKLARTAESSAQVSFMVAEMAAHAGNILAGNPVAIANELRESNVDALDQVFGELVARGGPGRIEAALTTLGQQLHTAIATGDSGAIQAAAGATGFLLSEANQAVAAYRDKEQQDRAAVELGATVAGILVGALVGGLVATLSSAAAAELLNSIVGDAGVGKDVSELLVMVQDLVAEGNLPSFGTIRQVVEAVALEHGSIAAKDAFDGGLKEGRLDSALGDPGAQASLMDGGSSATTLAAVDLSAGEIQLGGPDPGHTGGPEAMLVPGMAPVTEPDLAATMPDLAATAPELAGIPPVPEGSDLAGILPGASDPGADLSPPDLAAGLLPDAASIGSLDGAQLAQLGPPASGAGPEGFGGLPDPVFGATGMAVPDAGGVPADHPTPDAVAQELPDGPPVPAGPG